MIRKEAHRCEYEHKCKQNPENFLAHPLLHTSERCYYATPCYWFHLILARSFLMVERTDSMRTSLL